MTNVTNLVGNGIASSLLLPLSFFADSHMRITSVWHNLNLNLFKSTFCTVDDDITATSAEVIDILIHFSIIFNVN